MDVVYLFKHSSHGDEELRYSLRSVAAHLPWIRKVWVFGDRPSWLTSDTRWIEHVPHDAVAWLARAKTPVTNMFLLLELVALLPEVEHEFLLFCDDYILLEPLTEPVARRVRYVEDLDAVVSNRGTGLFREALWRTYDLLKRFGYPRLNYEVHVPVWLTKSRILAAARAFQDFMTEDRFHGPLAQTSIMNHARRCEEFHPISLSSEASYAGFHDKPLSYAEIQERCVGRQFLNFDDAAFNDEMRRFLDERFASPCHFEAGGPQDRPQTPSSEDSSSANRQSDTAATRPLGIPTAGHRRPPAARERCAVLVPHQGQLSPGTAAALQELERRGYRVRRISSDAPLDVVRNQAASDAWFEGFEEFLWIAPHTGFHPDQVERLRSHGLPLCSGVSLQAGGKALQLQPLPGTQQIALGDRGGLLEVLSVGAGFLHIQRSVYENIFREFQLPTCRGIGGRPSVPWYQPMVTALGGASHYLSDNFAFCHRARAAGVPIAVDTTLCVARLKDDSPPPAGTATPSRSAGTPVA